MSSMTEEQALQERDEAKSDTSWFEASAADIPSAKVLPMDLESGSPAPSPGLSVPGSLPTWAIGAVLSEQLKGIDASSRSHMDSLVPFFDIDATDVLRRAGWAFIPKPLRTSLDMCGPLLLACTLTTVLSAQPVSRGTRIGHALTYSFGYWALSSLLVVGVARQLSVDLAITDTLARQGYALAGAVVAALVAGIPFAPLLVALLSGAALARRYHPDIAGGREGTVALVALGLHLVCWGILYGFAPLLRFRCELPE
jgi:hypothetical protein